jgi:N-acetylmuramoyl-L-alanine amidase
MSPRFLLLVVLVVALLPAPAAAQQPADFAVPGGRFYTQAGGGGGRGYAVTDAGGVRFWSELRRLGGVGAVGYPASQRFEWDGFTVQVFQRVIFQWRPESQSVAFVNVFDRLHDLGQDDWLLRRHRLPPPRAFGDADRPWPEVVRARLAVLEPYSALAAAYLAAPGDPVQSNGLPVSEVVDAGNVLVVRAQRVVLQQWKEDVPWARAGQVTVALGGDIAKEAGILPDPTALLPTAPPEARAEAAPVVVLDAGHGGFESGAARSTPRLVEKDLVLDVARRLRDRLEAEGRRVVLTREADTQVNQDGRDLNGDGRVDVDDDLQARVDVSNQAGADLFISLHANGGVPGQRGLSTFYCPACPGAAEHLRLARALHLGVLAALAPHGAREFGAGVFDEASLGKPYGHLFVIGPQTPRVARPLRAPAAALVELLFVSDPADAALLARGDVREALADALRAAIGSFLSGG